MLDLSEALFSSLRRMAREAAVTGDGYFTGLSWYGGFARADLKRPQTEVE